MVLPDDIEVPKGFDSYPPHIRKMYQEQQAKVANEPLQTKESTHRKFLRMLDRHVYQRGLIRSGNEYQQDDLGVLARKHPVLRKKFVLWRGALMSSIAGKSDFRIQNRICFDRWTPTSLNRKIAVNRVKGSYEAVIFRIESKRNSRGIQLFKFKNGILNLRIDPDDELGKRIGRLIKAEREVLLPPEAKFLVVSKRKRRQFWYVNLQQI